MNRLSVVRNRTTPICFFGKAAYNGADVCVTMERRAVAIEPGVYMARIDMSPHLKYECPHLRVPARDEAAGGDAGIRIHILNYPEQTDGCLGVGTAADGEALDYSKKAFGDLMALLPRGEDFEVEIKES